MKTILMLSAAVVALAWIHTGPPETRASAQALPAKDEAKLAAAVSGMTAGPEQDCVSERDLGSNESFGGRVVLFHGPTNDVVYVNRLPTACPGLDSGRSLRVRTPASRLCRGDVATVFEPVSGMDLGGCSLGKFTPYRRGHPSKSE